MQISSIAMITGRMCQQHIYFISSPDGQQKIIYGNKKDTIITYYTNQSPVYPVQLIYVQFVYFMCKPTYTFELGSTY